MATKKKAGIHSPISTKAVEIIAQAPNSDPRLISAYMTLARCACLKAVGGYGPNMVSGAGAQKVAKVLSIGQLKAKRLVETLEGLGVIQKAAEGLKVGAFDARWVMTYPGDVQIPHALIDGVDKTSGIARLDEKVSGQSPNLITTAIVMLMHFYRNHDMHLYGGVRHTLAYHEWAMASSKSAAGGFRIDLSRCPVPNRGLSYPFFADLMGTLGVPTEKHRSFQPLVSDAHELLFKSGLVYEAVTLFSDKLEPLFPIRLNDRHASFSHGEHSSLQDVPGSGFYTNAVNENDDPEGAWLYLPIDPLTKHWTVAGVTRMRFRNACPSTAQGLARDANNIVQLKNSLVQMDLI
jgi:hypothetical protein